ncbi:MAG: hypothetical protein LBM75_09435 [Myxococcales bacterium]|jgi:hypothetical protein|nr:hypothetical protein [Myxococcales bacterium]
MYRLAPLLCLLALVLTSACAPRLIPGTLIEDTEEARQLLDLMGAYTSALESRNTDKLLALTSADFFETSGTPEGDDDFDRHGLELKLREWFSHFKSVRARVEVQKMTFESTPDGKIAKASVVYFYDISFQAPEGNGSDKLVWRTESDTKAMLFRLEDGLWKILSGI